jgi:hypothetical protein
MNVSGLGDDAVQRSRRCLIGIKPEARLSALGSKVDIPSANLYVCRARQNGESFETGHVCASILFIFGPRLSRIPHLM